MTLDELSELRSSGRFHHATYRNHGSVWEGLYVYVIANTTVGFDVAGVFGKSDPRLDVAYNIVRDTGVSVGAFGCG